MSKEIAVPELTVEQSAIAAIGFDQAKANQELTDLAGQSKDLVKVTNDDSYKQIHAARMTLKNRRVEIEKRAKAAREDATKFSKTVIEVEKRLIGLIQPEEQRVEAIQARIADIRSPVEFGTRFNTPSSDIAVYIKDTEAHVIDDWFQELRQQADDVKTSTLTKLREAYAAAVSREEEQRKAAEAQAELAKLRAEQAAREAKERAEREERERQERQKREAEEKAAREKPYDTGDQLYESLCDQ